MKDISYINAGREPCLTAEDLYSVVPTLRATDAKLAFVPKPRPIPPGEIVNSHAVECSLWLKGWVKLNYGESLRYGKRTQYARRKNWKAMRDGIQILRDASCSAPRWILYYARMLEDRGQVSAPGPMTVFSRGIVKSQIENALRYVAEPGGRALSTDRWKTLCQDYSLMQQDLRLLLPETREKAAKIVGSYFPGDSFRRRLAAVQAESAALQTSMYRALSDYAWIW